MSTKQIESNVELVYVKASMPSHSSNGEGQFFAAYIISVIVRAYLSVTFKHECNSHKTKITLIVKTVMPHVALCHVMHCEQNLSKAEFVVV